MTPEPTASPTPEPTAPTPEPTAPPDSCHESNPYRALNCDSDPCMALCYLQGGEQCGPGKFSACGCSVEDSISYQSYQLANGMVRTGSVKCNSCPSGQYESQPGGYVLGAPTGEGACAGECAPGSYSLEGAANCTVCEPGRFARYARARTCRMCEAGQFQAQPNATSCDACPLGHHQMLEGQTECVPQSSPGHFTSHGIELPCSAGSFASSSGQLECTPCPPGRYQSNGTSTSCVACESCINGANPTGCGMATEGYCSPCTPGNYIHADSKVCTACAIGQFQGDTDKFECKACTAGAFQGDAGKVYCPNCPPGQYSSGSGASECQPCQAARYSGSGAVHCTACEVGKYTNSTGSATCSPCPPGRYQPSAGNTTCVACESCINGANPTGCGMATEGYCSPCTPGNYIHADSKVCTACAIGQFQGDTDKFECKACTAGAFQGDAGKVYCPNCPPGQYSSGSGASECQPCQAARYSGSGAVHCTACEAGKYTNSMGSATCSPCLLGRFSATHAAECRQCAVGSYSSTMGAPVCTDCAVGKFQAATGQGSCEKCASAHFQEQEAESSCKSCPAGKHQGAGGKAFCLNVAAGRSVTSQASQRSNMTLSGVDVATFTGAVQLNFRRKLALELGVPMSQIKLANIAAVGPGRRLEVGSAIVTFTIIVFAASDSNPAGLETQSEIFAAMVSSETEIADSFQEAYRQSGLLAPVVTVAAATPPIVQVEVLELKCPRGKYYPPGVNSSECLLCGAGTYQDEPGSEYCRTCPTRATTDSGAASAMDCHCAPGYIMVENGTWASGSWTPVERLECRRCMQGANCSIAGTTVKNLVTEPGYWRASVSTTHFDSLSCAFDTCIGGAISARSATAPQRRARGR